MKTDKLSLSVGEISKSSIIARAKKRVPSDHQNQNWFNVQIQKEIEREKEQVFKADFMGSPWSDLSAESPLGMIAFLILALLLLVTSNANPLILIPFMIFFGWMLFSYMGKLMEDEFRAGANSDWHSYELEYSKAIEDIRKNKQNI